MPTHTSRNLQLLTTGPLHHPSLPPIPTPAALAFLSPSPRLQLPSAQMLSPLLHRVNFCSSFKTHLKCPPPWSRCSLSWLASCVSVCPPSTWPTTTKSRGRPFCSPGGTGWGRHRCRWLSNRGRELPALAASRRPWHRRGQSRHSRIQRMTGCAHPREPWEVQTDLQGSRPTPSTHVQVHTDTHSHEGGHCALSSWTAGCPSPQAINDSHPRPPGGRLGHTQPPFSPSASNTLA